jgi:hypothetical protein
LNASFRKNSNALPWTTFGARLRDGVDGGPGVHAGRRRQAATRHAELLERIRERERQVAEVVGTVVRGAIELVLDAVAEAPRHRDADAAGRAERGHAPGVHGRPREHDQVRDVPALQRQLDDLLLLDDLVDPRAADVDERRLRRDGDRLLDVAERELRVDDRVGVDLEHDARLDVRPERLGASPPACRDRAAGSGMVHAPDSSETTVRVNPVSVWVAVTVAPGSTRPLSS